ncbi:hypothetical protein P7H60_06360 [Vagococcus carniphilus]|uniref:hypothetical protein n=1 Tax=Vagococcus carniphilus TaxID=218144 RepID=UPI00288DA28C|nr:hypothetical protein [Vagococcus carniphilus]MDT2848779.1 hypothetical protein [Vagococcus carniphilus]
MKNTFTRDEEGEREVDNKWLCAPSVDTEYWISSEFFDTKQEAIDAAKEAIKKYNADPKNENLEDEIGYFAEDYSKVTSFAVGQASVFVISADVNYIIENIQEQAYSECGDSADGFLEDVTKEHKEELENIILDWFDKHNYKANFYKILNVEEIVLEVE